MTFSMCVWRKSIETQMFSRMLVQHINFPDRKPSSSQIEAACFMILKKKKPKQPNKQC